jgi:hypothetical protein
MVLLERLPGKTFDSFMAILVRIQTRHQQGQMKFTKQNYNEFKYHLRWHDYISIIINEFPIFLIRRYDWFHTETRKQDYDKTHLFQLLRKGFISHNRKHPEAAKGGIRNLEATIHYTPTNAYYVLDDILEATLRSWLKAEHVKCHDITKYQTYFRIKLSW